MKKTITVNDSNVDKVEFRRTGATIYLDDVSITDASVSGDCWINPMSAATPMGSYTLGDTMGAWNVNFEIGQTTWATSRVGIGTSTAGTGYNWGEATWYEDGTAPNKRVRRNLSGYKYTATGSHYVICQAVGTAGNTYASKSGNGWGNPGAYPPADLSSAYFTCTAITNPSSQAAITNTANPVTQIDLSWSKNGDGNNVLVLRKVSTDSWTEPTGGTSYSAGNTIGDGTVVYSGSGTSVTDTSLSGGVTYDYKFYSVNSDYYSPGVTAQEATMDCTPSAPTGLYANPTNSTGFTANWSAASLATNYYIDVSTSATFSASSGGPGTNHFTQSFTELPNSYTTGNITLSNQTWSGIQVYGESSTASYGGTGKAARINDDIPNAHIATPSMNTLGDVLFYYRELNTGGGDFLLEKSISGGAWSTIATQAFSGTTYTLYSNNVNDSSSDIKIRVVNDDNPGHLIVDEMTCTSSGGSSTPDYIGGYSNRLVGNTTSISVTGLTAGVTYYWRVRAEGPGDSCVSANSTASSVTTVVAVPSITLADNGTVSAGNVVTGTVNHVLIKFSTAVTTVGATLNAVAFTTGGSYDANDLTNLKLRYSTDATLDAGDATLGTITSPAAAGAKSFTGLSQGISAGSTGYFFITADIDDSADYGHTVSVSAIANADLTFAAGNKSGSASAGGAQTFIASAPTSNGSVDSFTAVGPDAMTVNWTRGNGERRIVVVRSGSATSWTPSDGTAPSGVNADFSSATDQANGNKICYDGTGTSFTLSGLSASTTYYVTIFEYNGTTTYVKYYTAGTEASGSQATAASAIWIYPRSAGTPMGTYYLGDTMGSWNVNFEIGQATWNYAQVGIGTNATGVGYNWGEAGWYADVATNPPNKLVRRDLSGYQYTETGSHYVICQAKANAGDAYTSKSGAGWDNSTVYPPSDLSSAYFTCSALSSPTSPTAMTNTANSATRVDLSWAQWNSKNVLITYSLAAPSGSPVQGTGYSAGNTFGNQTVVSGSQGGTSLTVTGLTPGQTYYFTFYSENHSYYSSGATATALTMAKAQARNTGGNTSPGVPAGTITLGDTAQVFTFESWGTIESAWGQGRLWLRQGNSDLSGGTAGAWGGMVNTDSKSVTSGVFNATGTWYWGIQMDYGATYGTDFWYKASSAAWADLAANGTGASLSFSVSAIVNPSGQTATLDAVNYTSEIDLGWTQNAAGNNVMVVRKLSTASWTEPTQGTGYVATDTIGAGTVIYNGSGTATSDTGLTEDTTYDYKFYSVNNDYYSPGVTAQEATDPCEPDPPATLWASATNITDFTAAWSASTHATNYFLDVSTSASFGGGVGAARTNDCDNLGGGTTSSYLTRIWTNNTDVVWTATKTRTDQTVNGDAAACLQNASGAYISTPDIPNGITTLKFDVQQAYSGSGGQVAVYVNGSLEGTFSYNTSVQTAEFNTVNIENVTSLVISNHNASARPAINNMVWTDYGSPTYVPGYSNRLTGAGTSQSVTGLTESTTYYFRLRAQGTGGCIGTTSTTANVTTKQGAPSAPTGLSASDGTSTTQVDVSWNDVGTETGYVIWRHTTDVFGSATAIGTNAADDTTYSDTDVAPLDVYYYWVTATNAIGSSAASNSDSGYAAGYTLRYTGFEGTTNDNWSWVPTAGAGRIGPRDDTGTATGKTGDYALLLRGSPIGDANPSVLFDNTTLPVGTSNISVSVSYACVGPDGSDNLILDISYDNGATWSISTQLIAGASNIRVNFGETRAGNTADANPYVVSIPDDTAQVRVRVRFEEASADNTLDRFFIDELKLIAGKDLPTVKFDTARTVTNETAGTITIPVTISSAADATVRVAIAGTALPGGVDFTATTTNLVFTSGGSTSVDLELAIVDDTIAEGPESVRFTLTQADGCRVAGPDIHTLFIRDDDAFSVVSANLVSGTVTIGDQTAYDDAGQNLLKALCPDIVAIQEWVVTNSFAQFVSDNFGSDYYWVTDGTTGQYAMPNGIISRWPIVDTNIWDDAVGYRQHIHAKIDLPGTKKLNLVSVHLKAGDTTNDVDARILGARNLTNAIATAGFSSSDYLLIAGDLNTTNRSAVELAILTNVVSDAHKPTDKAGSENTNPSKARPYDYVMPDSTLEIQYVGMTYNGTSFPDGLIFDTREWGDHQYPALGSDSVAPNLTHAPVMKVFSLGEIVEPPQLFTATASAIDQIDLAFTTNAEGDGIVIVYNETGTFTDPVGAPPASGAYAGGTVVYRGTGSSHNHTGLESCTLYYYKAWSYSATPVFSTALTASDTTDAPVAPTALHASATNQNDFTAAWTAASGAASYVIDVSEDSGFGGGAAVNLMSNGSFETGDTTDWDTVESEHSVVTTDPQEGTYHVAINATATRKLMQQVSITGDGTTEYEVSFYSKGTGNARIWASWSTGGQDSGDDLQPSTYLSTQSSWTKVTYNVVPSTGANVLNFEIRTYTGASRQYDNFFVGKAGGAAPSYVDGYEQRPVAGSSVSVTGLTDLVTYYFRVASVGDGGCTSSYTAVENVTTLAGPPPQPTGLTATKGTETAHVALSWTDVSAKETGYVIYRHTADAFGSATAIYTNAANVVTYNDTTAAVGTRYYYWIVATNAIGSSAASDSDYGFRKLATVGGLSASDCSDTAQVSLSWTDIAGETGYGIWRNTSDNSSTATFLGSAAADATSYNDTTATPGTLYTYWVRATNSTLVTQSDFQASGASGVRKLATVTVSASDGTDTARVVVQWTEIVGETGYSVWRSETDSSATAEWLANVVADGDVLSENFEDSWAEAPSGWSRELVNGTTEWTRDSGGQSGNPAAAHGGTYNALFYSGSSRGSTNRLMTPSMDLSGFSSANLNFWHAQTAWLSDQDIMRVLYRTSSVASWVELAEYTNSMSTWTERNLELPNRSADYYVAFEAVGDYGYGVVLDDVAVTGTVSSITNYYDVEAVAGTQYYYWVLGTNSTSGCYSDFGTGDGGWRRLVENPSSAELTRDGREMVRAAIAPNANTDDILVLYSTTAEVNGVPALNSSYSVGDTLGNAKVIYTGTATNFREHVVKAETTNHYRVFSVLSNIYYSSGTIPTGSPVETKAYQVGVGVETFSYTNVTLSTDSFTNKSGGANWAAGSNWVLEASGTSWQVFTNDTYDGRPMFFTAASNMATHSGNRAFIDLNGAGRWGNATRQLPTVSTGTVFVSALMAYRYEGSSEGTDRWLTMALMNGSTEELEFGKVWGANRTFTIRRSGANAASSYGLNPYGDSTNNWYWVVLKYDFENDVAKAAAFYRGENIPSTEPSTWDVEWSSMSIAQVTGLRLKAGSGADWLGGGLFDEVRVSSVWPALLGEPDLVITPEEKNFGETEVGRTDVQTFWVQNIGGDNVPLSVSSLMLGGTDPTNFFLSTNTLGTIEYGQSNSFTVTFLPNVQPKDYSATLFVTNSSGVNPVTVALLGAGIPSQLTNAPAIDEYWVGVTNQVTDAMVTSGVFSVVIDAYHPAGIATATYDLLNSASTVILADQTFESWTSANGEDYVFSNATHAGYWPATPADDYLVRVTLISSNGYGTTNTTYGVMGGVESDDLFISEYIEGSSNNKAIEIYNGTGAGVDLSSYTLRLYFNGGTSPSSISLSGTLAAGAVYVVAHSSANAAILAQADQTTASLAFNGNDVVALAKNGSNIDVVGTIGSSVYFAKDVTKVRKSSVTDGVTTYATSEWDNKASDTISFLGAHTMDGGVVGTLMEFAVIDDDTEAPVITSPLVNGVTTPAGSADGPSIAIGDVSGAFALDWDIQDTGSGVFAASNHYTLTRSNVVISSGAVTAGSDGDGQASALAVSTTVPRASMIWGHYVLSLAGHDYDAEWVGDISSVSNVYYFVIAAPSIGVDPTSLAFGTVERNISSNLTLVVTNSGNADLDISSIGFTGTGSGYFTVASPVVPLTVTPGDSADVVVTFTPTAGGTFNVTMTLNNNSPDHPALEVPITAVCFDPETAPPSIYDFTAVDSRAVTNEVTDHALGHSEVTLNFTLWHYTGMSNTPASYDLLDPAGNLVWTNGTFDLVTGVTLGTKTCQVFSATVPGFYPAVTGVYTARVTAVSSNGYSVTDEAAYAPLNAGEGAEWPLDRFSRPDAVNDIGAGWVPTSTGETNHNIQLRDHALQFYGEGGTAGNGRLSVVRDVSSRYNTVLTQNSGTLTWAFNFYSGQANMTGLGSGKYAGLYVLGSTSANFVGGSGDGYAVRICSNQVALVRFTGGLNADSDATTIGTSASLSATTPMGVRVDLDPATGAWTLYTTNWGGTGPDAFGDPLAAAELATSTVDATYLGATSLPYVGCYWNHGAATPSSTYGAVFDEVYAPYVMPTAPLMNFSVVDEDWTGPVHSDFNTGQYTVSYIDPGGLTVTGLVADANGVYAGTSNVWTLFSNSTQVASGFMTMTPDTDGAGTTASPAALSTTIPFSALNTTNGTFIFQLVSTDYDVDRPGDSMSTTSSFTIVIVDTEAPTPTSVTAVGDGMEMAVLTWNLNGAQGAVVLRSADPDAIAGATILTMGEDYNQGDAGPNGTTVAYHGTNQAGAEIVLPMGSSNHFRLFGANGTVYSAGYADPTNSVQLLEYEDGEIVDQFAYTNNYIWTHDGGGTNWVYLNDQAPTGQGWDGGWTGDSNKVLTIENINLLSGSTHYPDPYANKLQWVANSQVATNVEVVRKLATKRSGRTFIAFMMNYKVGTNSCSLTNKYLGLSLMSGTDADKEEIFFGKVHGYDKDGGIEVPGVGKSVPASPDNYAFNAKHGDDYMIVGEWDPGIHTIRMWAFHQGDTNPIPQEYTNATPFAVYSNAALNVADITGIRLAAGMSEADTNSLDHVYFDEVRVGDTWDEVLLFNYPEAWNFRVGEQRGTGTNAVYVVTDGELAEPGKAYPISYLLNHRTGVTNAQFNISTNTSYLTGLYDSNIDLELDPANATDRSRWFTNWVTTRLDTNDVTLGVYTTRVWMTAVSGKATNTIFMEGRAGATDLFFGEFGEGRYWDKYVEIYNGTGGSIDLYDYFIAHQNYGAGVEPDYTNPWINFCRLSPTSHNLEHGKTMLILNGESLNYTDLNATLADMTNALIAAGRDYLITTNDALQVSGNDPVGLFKTGDMDNWIDMCGIAPEGGTVDRYIMRRLENAEVPRFAPLTVATNQWDYRDWAAGTVVDSPDYTNFLATAGIYDRDVGLGGYITFTVEDDDTEPPRMGANSALMVGTEAPYTSLTPSIGAVEVVLTAWNFVGSTVEEASRPWADSLLTNASVSCSPAYTPELIDYNNSGTSENDLFDGYDQPNKGVAGLASIGSYFTQAETAWIQYEIELTSAEEMVLSWAEAGGNAGFETAQLWWSSDGQNFSTNAAWPSWVPRTGGASTYVTRYAEFDGVVDPGLSKVYIRIVLGPGYGTASGTYRMDNVQLTGYPQEFQVTDGQIAASGNKFQFRANVYDTNSGLDKAQATMALQGVDGTRVASRDIGDGSTTNSTLWWELDVTRDDITDYVNASLSGKGMTINVKVPDADADRPNDQSWLDGRIGQVRVIDDDTKRPKLTLTSMKPLSSILAQWAQITDTNSLLPTKSDAGVDAEPLKTKSGTDDPKNPNISRLPTNGYHYIEAFAWHGQQKCWLIEVTPEADMALTNLTFTSYLHRTNGVSNYRIDHYVDGALEDNILSATYWVDPPGILDPDTWYTRSHGWAPDTVVLEAGKVNQIRIYGLGASNIGARWRISELTLWQAAMSTDGVTEVTDAEFTSGTFKLEGNAWDTGSGIASPTHPIPAKRPMFSLNAPDGGVLVSNQVFSFIGEVVDGGATTKEEGAFEGLLPTPVYTNVMLGAYTGEAHVWDYDDDRTDDDLLLRGDLAMYVVDNDIMEPTTVGVVRVNGSVVPEMAPDRFTVDWNNQPEFIVSFDSVAVDQDPGDTYSAKQRTLTGIGEYRVATNANINSLSPSNRATLGKPYAVATTNGALANYGFEMPGEGWTLDANCSYRSLIVGGTDEVKEGTNSLRQINGGVASQTIEFRNTAGTAPTVGVSGWYRSDTVGGPTFRIEAFATNNLTTPVATRDLQPGTAATWSQFEIDPPEAIGDGTVEVLKVSLIDGGGNTTFWDDIRLSVDIGTNTPSMRFMAGPENQGLNPQYLFAVDADNNRAGDRLAGEAKPFYIAYDITPPTKVGQNIALKATTDSVDDPTTQFDLEWSTQNVGPDDPAHANHPTQLGTDRDLLSPWGSYKIYYGAYDVLDIPAGDPGPGSIDAYIYTNFIVAGTYKTWSNRVWNSVINDPGAPTYQANYHALTNMGRNTIRLYDLDFDQDYAVIIVGVDKAGNEGPADIYSWATNNTIKFALTRGWCMAKDVASNSFPEATLTNALTTRAAALAWTASGVSNPAAGNNVTNLFTEVKKDYDLIYWDAPSFRESADNEWKKLSTVRSNWYVDDGGQGRQRGSLRFYRASYKDRWKTTRLDGTNVLTQRPIASEEVYAQHNVVLSPGQNFVALHGVPYSNTFEAVFGGTETFPGNDTALNATKVEFFTPGTNANSSAQYYLNASGRWLELGGGQDVTTNMMATNFFNRGFSITLPEPLPEAYVITNALDWNQANESNQPAVVDAMIWSPIAQVPTNGFRQVIYCGSQSGRVQTLVYNVVALRLPVATHPSQMRLLESGFVNGYLGHSDQIYTMNTATKQPLAESYIYCDQNGDWKFSRTGGPVPGNFFQPNDVIVIVSRNWVGTGQWTWTYHPGHFYPNAKLPDRWMGH